MPVLEDMPQEFPNKKPENSGLNQVYAAAASGAKVIEDFQKFHDELKEAGDVLEAAGCKSFIDLVYKNEKDIFEGFTVKNFGGEYRVRLLSSGNMTITEDDITATSSTYNKEDALTFLLSSALDALSVSDKNKIAQYKKSQEAKKMTEQELFIHSSGATAVARANQP